MLTSFIKCFSCGKILILRQIYNAFRETMCFEVNMEKFDEIASVPLQNRLRSVDSSSKY